MGWTAAVVSLCCFSSKCRQEIGQPDAVFTDSGGVDVRRSIPARPGNRPRCSSISQCWRRRCHYRSRTDRADRSASITSTTPGAICMVRSVWSSSIICQLISPDDDRLRRDEQVGRMTRQPEAAACVLGCRSSSSATEPGGRKERHRFALSHPRESGAIERPIA